MDSVEIRAVAGEAARTPASAPNQATITDFATVGGADPMLVGNDMRDRPTEQQGIARSFQKAWGRIGSRSNVLSPANNPC